MKKTKIIAIANQKGGVGKTTTAVNLTASLATLGKKAMLIDLDPQSNATISCLASLDKSTAQSIEHNNAYHLLLGQLNLQQTVINLNSFMFDLLPASPDLTAAEIDMLKVSDNEQRLKRALVDTDNSYDYIIVDCPPAINLITLNALTAANSVLIPMQCEFFSLEGIALLVDTIATLKKRLNPTLSIEGVLRTMYDPRITLSQDVTSQLKQSFGTKVFSTTIPRNVRLAEAPSHGMPCLYYDKSSKGALSYLSLASELV